MKIERDYFRLGDLAKAWECSVEDIHHLFIHGKLKIGIACHGERLFGTNAKLRTVGAYAVSGVLIIPSVDSEDWEFDPTGIAKAGGFKIDPGYPPEITPVDNADAPPFFSWATGRDLDHPETDVSRIEWFHVGVHGIDEHGEPALDWHRVDPDRLVVHKAERARFEKADRPRSKRAETTDLNIIGGLVGLMLGKTPAGKYQSVYRTQEAIIDALLASYPNKAGIAESTLKGRFAKATKELEQS
jgi:hypothetical protein